MYKTKNINDLELLYSILREEHPKNQIEITFNYNTKEYLINVTSKPYKFDPDVPVDVNIEIVYGDSVTGDTPLLLRDPLTKLITIKTIESLTNETSWKEYPEFKIFDNANFRSNKQYSLNNYEVWSDSGWNPIKKIIRHKTNKKIYRVTTTTSCIDVTEDHSLCAKNLDKLKPSDLIEQQKCSIELLHNFPNVFNNSEMILDFNFENTLESDNDILNCTKDIKHKFCKLFYKKTFYTCKTKLQAAKLYYLLKNIGYNVKIYNINNSFNLQLSTQDLTKHPEIKKIEYLRNTNDEEFVYDLETENGRFHAGIGELILYNTDSIFCKVKFNRDDFEKNRIDTFKLAELCGEKLTNEVFDRPPIVLEFEKVFHPFILLTKKRYIANKFENMKDPFQLKGIDAKGIALTRRDYCKMVKNCYQEIINTIMSDKTTTGEMKVDNNTTDSIKLSIDVYKKYINDIYNYKIKIDDLIISAMLAKEYSCKLCKKKCEWILKCDKCKTPNPGKLNICKTQKCKNPINCPHTFSLAHINLAQELLKRNEEVSVGDRIAYIFVESDNTKAQKNELAEDPKYAIQNNLKFNRTCYLEQLAKPILGFFKIVLKDNLELLDETINYTNDMLIKCGGKALRPSDFKLED